MKKLIFIFAIAILFCACSKKETVAPQIITKTDTVNIVQHDTVYCTPKSDIIQGTWYYYGYSNYGSSTINNVTSQQMTCTQTTMNFYGSSSASFSSNYSLIYLNGGVDPFYKVYIYNCNELKLTDQTSNGSSYYFRRTP